MLLIDDSPESDFRYGKPIVKFSLQRLRLVGSYLRREPIHVQVNAEIAHLMDDYLATRRQETQRLREALAAGEFELILQIGHDLKGTGGCFGLDRLSAIGSDLEEAAQRRDLAGIRAALFALTDFLDRIVWSAAESIPPSRRKAPD